MSAESVTLGKRKDREVLVDAAAKPHGPTIFVSNLPYSATSTDLNTLFSDLGPVRSAFVVLDPDTGSSKGVGYVSFAIKEDAELAYEKVNGGGEGLLLDRRKLRAQWADSKHHKEKHSKDGQVKKESQEPNTNRSAKSAHPSGPHDPLAIRTIVVAGLPSSIDSKSLWKKVRKYDHAEKVEWPVQKDGVEDRSTANVLFASPAAAQEAVTKLHAHVFKGALLSVTLKKRLDGLAKPTTRASKASKQNNPEVDSKASVKKSAVPAPSRANRLIVRNLPFDVTEQDLRAVFLPYGPIHSIHIPVKDPEPKEEGSGDQPKPRTKGYAFVWMLSRKDAEKAVEGANGTKVRAGMADAMVRDKQKRKKLRREEAKMKESEKARKARKKEKDGEEQGEDENGGDESGEDERSGEEDSVVERVIAVDWALSKDKWEEAKAKMQEVDVEGDKAEDGSDHDGSDEESGNDEDDESGSDGGSSHIGVHDGDSDAEDDSDEEDDEGMDVDEDGTKLGKPQLPPPETGTTLFVRNVPFEATDDELRTTFRAFGPLRYARIAMDYETGRSRGTGFVCFWNKADADKVIEQSEILRSETMGGQAPEPKKNPFKLPSLLTPDPSASIAQNLVLQGRTMDVIRAVTRDEANKLKEAGERQREKADKRNLYLLREGIIMPNTPAAASLSPADLEKRTQSYNARRALLRSNPSLFVSRTRLSVRQLPLFVTERMLKRLAIYALREFNREVKAGSRSGLTEDELEERPEEEEEDGKDRATSPQKYNGKGKAKAGRDTGVKQSKIIRQHDRVDPATGKGRSRGYGFLEMHKHADSLRVLRWANNNPEVGTLFGQWWREELEDLIKAEKKQKTEDGRLERLKEESKQGGLKKGKGSLNMEFSIENVQVVKRRAAMQQEQRSASSEGKKPQRRASLPNIKVEAEQNEEHPRKKRRTSDPKLQKPVKEQLISKPGGNIGSLIGRKRKERKGKQG